jgi:beta-galactosidase
LCGFEKPGFWFRKALWDDEPLVYIAVPFKPVANNVNKCSFWGWPDVISHWNHPVENDTLKVQVYTNCPEVELYLNDKSLGSKKWDIRKEAFLTWDVPYQPGKLEAVGTSINGIKTKYKVETAGKPAKIVLTPDRKTMLANKRDVTYIKVELVDDRGNLVPFAENQVTFSVKGAGKLAAVGNGNPASHTSFQGNEMEAWRGRCLAIVQSGDKPETIELEAHSEGLQTATVTIEVKNPPAH